MTYDCLAGGGEMGALMRSKDWSQTPFGPVETWPQSLRTAISLMLHSRFAMVIAWGPEFRFFYNDRYRIILGASKHPGALGAPAKEIFPEAWPQIGPLFESTRRGEAVGMDDLLIPLDRYGYLENCYFSISYSPIRDESGGIGGMLAVVAETTERVQGERRLKTLRDLSRRAADATTPEEACINAAEKLAENPIDVPFALLYLLSKDGKTTRLQSASGLEAGTAASPETVLLEDANTAGWPLAFVANSGSAQIITDLQERFGPLPGGPYPEKAHSALVMPLIRPGQVHPDAILVFGISPRRALEDQYRAFFELAGDHILTAIRNAIAYQEEREKAEQLAELDRAKTVFFSNVSHEFRTPLTLMLGPLEDMLARDSNRLPSDDVEQLSLVHRNSLRLLKLVNALLDFSRIESGRIEATYEPVELASYTTELASVFRSAVERAGLQLIVDCPPLPEKIYIDKEMWEKIVLNLLSNAFKFTFDGAITVRLSWAVDHIELEVKDTGTGIPEQELPNLFKRFHRVRGARSRSYEGSGIGLALVQELVRLHGGTISVASGVDSGTTFTVSIPSGSGHLAKDRILAERKMSRTGINVNAYVEEALRWLPDSETESHDISDDIQFEDAQSDTGNDFSLLPARGSDRPLVLLADDNADMRQYVKRLLEPIYRIEAVADGAEALSFARQQKPDLILSDVMMPKLDGFELLRGLRADLATQNVPVIMLSARAGEESRVEGLQAGADDYLVKPFSARELLARVKAHVDLNLMRQEARRQATFLAQASETFIESLDYETTLKSLARIAVQHLADWCVIDIVDEKGELRRVAAAHRDSAKEQLLIELQQQFPPDWNSTQPSPRVVRTGRSELVEEMTDALISRRAKNNHHKELLKKIGLTSYMAVALTARGNKLGAINLCLSDDNRRYSQDDLKLAEEIGRRAAIAIDNARLYYVAQDANRIKDEFLATVSHELRTPLSAVLGWSRLLKTGKLDAKGSEQAVEAIERNARAQVQLIEDLLDISRIISGKLRLDVRAVDMVDVIRAAIDAVRPAADAKNIHIQSGLNQWSDDIVLGDPSRLQQVVWNLLSNAIKFTPMDGQVQITLARINSHLEIKVSDTGQGINPEFLPHIFERFRQADSSTTRQHGGLGLGLAIVRHLVEMHGGEIRVNSAGEGKGATFTVSLPISIARDFSLGKRADESDSNESLNIEGIFVKSALEGLQILVVDDEKDARDFLTTMLSQYGATVRAAGSAAEAFEILQGMSREKLPDVLVSDIGMPAEDGYSLIRRLRMLSPEEGGQIKAIALTAYARLEDRMRALAAGFQMHVAKPVDASELTMVIVSLTGRMASSDRYGDRII